VADGRRKTGITLADRGVYDEHGLEPISGIFSSPEKSPPKRSDTITASESMDVQESSIPDLTTSHQILRNSRTLLPPPRSRSPKKTALGSSPRRQSSMAPRGSSIGASSPIRAASHPAVARRLEFEHDESSVHETPALSGSGQRRGKRSSVYDIPEDASPVPDSSAVLEESLVQEEITANEDSIVISHIAEESIAQIGDETMDGAEASEDVDDVEETEATPEPVKEPVKGGRKRKSDALDPAHHEDSSAAKSRKTTKKPAPVPAASSRRSKRVSDLMEQESSALDASADVSLDAPEEAEEAPVAIKRRGRPPRAKSEAEKEKEKENVVKTKGPKAAVAAKKGDEVFKKPQKPATKPQAKPTSKINAKPKSLSEPPEATGVDAGKLVDVHGHPLSKKDIEHMSTTSTGSRFGRGRHLSVFRELEPEAVARVGRTGRHRVAPIDFWKNDRIAYDPSGGMTSIVKNQDPEPERKSYKASGARGKKRPLTAIEEEEVVLDPWEEEDGVLVGNYRDFDPITDVTSSEIIEDSRQRPLFLESIISNNTTEIAWAQKGIKPVDVPDGSFQYTKLSSVGSFFNWGVIELRAEQMKRSKNSRKMHMVFNVQSGTVEVKVHENEFTVHRGGIWQVPRGKSLLPMSPFRFEHIFVFAWSAIFLSQSRDIPRLH
jgi:centromere protein C